jgi:hypothetical protein
MTDPIRLHVGNSRTPIYATLKQPGVSGDLEVVVLTGLTVKFLLVNAATGSYVIAETSTGVAVLDEDAGTVSYTFSLLTIPAGVYWGYFRVYSGATFDSFPVEHAKLIIKIDSDTQSAEEAAIEQSVLFPETLVIGDTYTADCGTSIRVYLRDENGTPVTALGNKDFLDADFAPELVITQTGLTGRVKATVTYVDAAEDYLTVEIPSSETRRAVPGSATVQCVLRWDGVQHVLFTRTLTWVPVI